MTGELLTTDALKTVGTFQSISAKFPEISGAEIAALLVPPPQFNDATFASYRPDPDFPSQHEALERLKKFADVWKKSSSGGGFIGFGRSKTKSPISEDLPGVYLDGGFGVGKTHLLAALWHAAAGPKYFGTFIEYTSLVGALGYVNALELLSGSKLVCIDEFELDDPGDTMLMSRFVSDLVAGGTRVAATSNTPPAALGEGRFAAESFLREIQNLSAKFKTVRIDGLDYRRRSTDGHAFSFSDAESVVAAAKDRSAAGERVSLDRFDDLIVHLAKVHPAKYTSLIDGFDAIAITEVRALNDQNEALRLVAFIDRAYDAGLPILANGTPLDEVFPPDMMNGGFRKKYLRCVSRMISLTSAAEVS